MGIKDALDKSKKARLKTLAGNRDRLSDGFLSVSDAVFEVSLYHLGEDFENWRYEPLNERDFILSYLDKNNVLK